METKRIVGIEVYKGSELVNEWLDSTGRTDDQLCAEIRNDHTNVTHVAIQTNNRGAKRHYTIR